MSDSRQDVRRSYDAVAATYADRLGDELDGKPLDRALLAAVCELATGGPLADLGCGPGHVTRWLAARHPDVLGVDLSPGMVAQARRAAPGLRFEVGSLLALPLPDGSLAGAVALYSVIHLDAGERIAAFTDIRRVLRPGGHLLVSVHVDAPGIPAGTVHHSTALLDHAVALDHHFISGETLAAEVARAGLTVVDTLERGPVPDAEYPSNRAYVLARR